MPALPPRRPLLVRLRNWVGDVILGVPMLRRLQDELGFELHLVGKGWAASLLEGEGWPVQPLAADRAGRIAQWRQWAAQARATDAGFDARLNALLLPFSFSAAWEARRAGLRALGHAGEGRRLLLARAVPRPRTEASGQRPHESTVYWHLGDALAQSMGQPSRPAPTHASLHVSQAARARVAARLTALGLHAGQIVVLCPFAGGQVDKQDKRWPHFATLADRLANVRPDLTPVLCPGPGEEAEAASLAAAVPAARWQMLDGLKLADYAALLEGCALMISNDTGPGHLAAAVGSPLISVLGPTPVAQWGPRGPRVTVVQGEAGAWPAVDAVLDAAERAARHVAEAA